MSSSKTSKSPFLRASSCWTPSKKGDIRPHATVRAFFAAGGACPQQKSAKGGRKRRLSRPFLRFFQKVLAFWKKARPLGCFKKGESGCRAQCWERACRSRCLRRRLLRALCLGQSFAACCLWLGGAARDKARRRSRYFDGDRAGYDARRELEDDASPLGVVGVCGRHGDSRQKGCCPNFGQGKSTGQWSGPSRSCLARRREGRPFQKGCQGGTFVRRQKDRRKAQKPFACLCGLILCGALLKRQSAQNSLLVFERFYLLEMEFS